MPGHDDIVRAPIDPALRATGDRVGKADEGVSPHSYLITASVLASKKWMRSGTKTSRIFS